jgi:alpha-tubulin suppressor-like RCC1 family protein
VVTHSAGATTVYANQQTNSGYWSTLGQFAFAAGTNGNVRVQDNFAEPSGVALVDGMKFVLVSAVIPPPAPTGLNASAVSTSRIDLAWVDVTTNETGFLISRSTNSGGPYGDITTVPPNTTNYSNNGLVPDKTYFYVVRTVTAQGVSTNSNEASARTLAIPTAPTITAQPKSASVLVGQTALFDVSVTGTAPVSYQWRFNGSNISGATQSSLTLPSAQFTNSGTYSLFVSNAYGTSLSSNAFLSVSAVGAWGNNNSGQTTVPPAATNVIAIAAGGWHSLALQGNGRVIAWGNNYDGQCDVPEFLTDAIAIAAGGYHSLAIRMDGSVAGWGADDYGQADVPPQVSEAMDVAAGKWHSLALMRNGEVVGWGDNSFGQLNGTSELGNIIAISAGGNHSLALTADGLVHAWGENTDANGFIVGQSVVPPDLSNVIAVAAGVYHSLALKADGTVVAWGDNSKGQGNTPAGLSGVIGIAAGSEHSLALREDGAVVGWGANFNGQLGFPNGLSNSVAVAAGEYHTLILQDSTVPTALLIRPVWAPERFTALAQSLQNRNYSLEYRTAVNSGVFQPLPALGGNGRLLLFADPAPGTMQRFYRLRQWRR